MEKLTSHNRQSGTVIIIVLWTSVLLTILVTAMAGKVRLSAKAASFNQQASGQWAQLMAAVNQAEMELMIENMARPIGEQLEESEEGELRIPAYRFNGQPLTLNYPQDENFVVRIYNHGGKINLNRIPRRSMQQLIENRLGGPFEADPEQVQDLLTTWTDWTDLNSLEGINGAENEYYQSLDQPYFPRNNPELDTVEEILHVKGFAELFEGVNLEAAFTIYGNSRALNFNLATREALQLLPGLDDELIETIIAYREVEDISNLSELGEIIPFENFQEVSPWFSTNAGEPIYSVFVYPKAELNNNAVQSQPSAEQNENEFDARLDPVRQAYMEIVEVRSFNSMPLVHQVNPYGVLPDTAPARIEEYGIELPQLD
ncbi:MAG: general secretion pathway protein GspK [Pseudohongiellaceae bacterium]